MTLTIGTGPFGDRGEKAFNFEVRAPRDHVLFFEDSPGRVRVVFGGETVADSRRVKLMHEAGLLPVYYFPEEDIRRDLLEDGDHTTYCPFQGRRFLLVGEGGGPGSRERHVGISGADRRRAADRRLPGVLLEQDGLLALVHVQSVLGLPIMSLIGRSGRAG